MKKTFFILSTVFVLALTGCADPVNYVEQTLTTAATNQESEEVEIAEVPLMLRAIETTEDEPIEETPELIIEEPEEEVVVAEPTEPETTNTEVVNELEVTDEQQRAIDRRVLDCLAKLYGKTSPKYSLSWLCQYEGIVIFSKSGENTNHIKCTMENLQKAADVLGVSADYLINGEI